MAPKKRKGGLIRDLTVGEDFRIGVNLAIKKFRNTEEENGEFDVDKLQCILIIQEFPESKTSSAVSGIKAYKLITIFLSKLNKYYSVHFRSIVSSMKAYTLIFIFLSNFNKYYSVLCSSIVSKPTKHLGEEFTILSGKMCLL